MRKFIFLDVDGVLNCQGSKSNCYGALGIDNDKVERLAEIIKATGALIILVSTWKEFWFRTDKEDQNELARYLDRKLKRCGLRIADKTWDRIINRGEGIINWIQKNIAEDCQWIVLDDEVFPDYQKFGILPHLVKTSFSTGITSENVKEAIFKLNAS